MTAVAKSYWRSILRGTRTFAMLPAAVQEDVRALARQASEDGVIDAERYRALTGAAAPEEGTED